MPTYSRSVLLLSSALLLVAARRPPPPSGELLLDAADPVISVEIAGVPLRLRVDLDRQDSVELNPAAAARLPVKWEAGYPMDVGRIRLDSRAAPAILKVEGRTVPTQLAQHGRDCCAGVDGAVGPDLLPFATVRWRRSDAPASTDSVTLPLEVSVATGLSAPAGVDDLRLRFAFTEAETVGTAAAGATLAQLWGGSWTSAPSRVALAFGVTRPARVMAFARPGLLGGFRFDRLLVRISDFAGDEKLPTDPARPGEVVVARHLPRQHAWPAVTIGNDRLSRCAEIVYQAEPRSLTLNCAFDRP